MSAIIVIVHADSAVQNAVSSLCAEASLRVCSFQSAEALLEVGVPHDTGCFLVDHTLPGLSGWDLLTELESRNIQHPALILSGVTSFVACKRALKMGLLDFIGVPFDDEELLESIHLALRSDTDNRNYSVERRALLAAFDRMPARRRRILCMVISGVPRKRIAEELGISQQTVSRQHTAILHAFKVNSDVTMVRRLSDADVVAQILSQVEPAPKTGNANSSQTDVK